LTPIIITGAAGFIGYHVSQRFLAMGREVVGIDNLNDYYDVSLKVARLAQLQKQQKFRFLRLDLAEPNALASLFKEQKFELVIHLAAQAGVRYSLSNPEAYIKSNIEGFLNVLEACRHHQVEHLLYASSSSVYGANTQMPFSCSQNTDHPVSLYGATKKANELMAHTYSHLFGLPTTGLRFFTVYGPWGRPDMALFLFTKAILAGQPISVFNNGEMQRDFTYIDDIVEGIYRLSSHIPTPDLNWNGDHPDPSASRAPYKIYNIGNNEPVQLLRLIEILEKALGVPAIKKLLPLQPGDVLATYADINDLNQAVGFRPCTPIEMGVERFVAWYRAMYTGVPSGQTVQLL
jgi:UDP-glucuronate 4-epimerase